MTTQVAGYAWNQWRCPFTLAARDLNLLKQTVLFTEMKYLCLAGECWQTRWCDFWMVTVFLCRFLTSSGAMLQYSRWSIDWNQYLAAVRKRFYQWILDTCKPFFMTKPGSTINWKSVCGIPMLKNPTMLPHPAPHGLRYWCLHLSIAATIKPFAKLIKGINIKEGWEDAQAWFKSVTLPELRFGFIPTAKITIFSPSNHLPIILDNFSIRSWSHCHHRHNQSTQS